MNYPLYIPSSMVCCRMLSRTVSGIASSFLRPVSRIVRPFSAAADDGKGKDPNVKEVLGEELLSAVDAVANEVRGKDAAAVSSMKSSLLSRLISHEKETFNSATQDQTTEMLADPGVMAVLKDAAAPIKTIPRAIQERKMRKGVVLLRKEIFYQAVQNGYKAEEARKISEEAVAEAEERVTEKMMGEREEAKEQKEAQGEVAAQRAEKEQKLFDLAFQMADKMLYEAEGSGAKEMPSRRVIQPDPKAPKYLSSKRRLNIFTNPSALNEKRIGFWEDWELQAAKTWNEGLGPSNAFEEQIQWTREGKQWPFPIDNEYLLGDEASVPFYEHIFVDRRLAASNLPKEGPIAHFMHLVAVGLSKNPHMTAAAKAEHLEWFISFFNEEKQNMVHRLHEQELAAAAQA